MGRLGPTRLVDMRIDKISLVDRGANGRRFAILKRADAGSGTPSRPATFGERIAVQKAAPTFADLLTSQELGQWLPGALDALAETVMAALYLPDETGEITPAVRAQAAMNAFDDFAAAGKERVAGAIGKRHGVSRGNPARAEKRDQHWSRGLL